MSQVRAMRRHRRLLPVPAAAALQVLLLLVLSLLTTSGLPLSERDSTLTSAAPVSSGDARRKSGEAAKFHIPPNFTNDSETEARAMTTVTLAVQYMAKKISLQIKKGKESSNEDALLSFQFPDSFVKEDGEINRFSRKVYFQKKPVHKPLDNYYEKIFGNEQAELSNDDLNSGNGNPGVVDQEMVESEIVLQRSGRKSECCHRFTRSPVSSRKSVIGSSQEEEKMAESNTFLFDNSYSVHQPVDTQGVEFAMLSAFYDLELSDAIDHMPAQISVAQYVSGETINANNRLRQQLSQTPIWEIGSVNNVPYGDTKYETQYRRFPEPERGRGDIPHLGGEAHYTTQNLDFPTLTAVHNSKDTEKQGPKNFILRESVSDKRRQLGNKKRDLSPQYMTLGENNGIERSTLFTPSAQVLSGKLNDPTLRHVLTKLLATEAEPPHKSQGRQGMPGAQHVFGAITSQEDILFSEEVAHEDIVSISPFIQRSPDYERAAISDLTSVQEYNFASSLPQDPTFHVPVGEPRSGFELHARNSLQNGHIFHSDVDGVGLFSAADPQRGIRLFKRSAAPQVLSGVEAPHLFPEALESESGHLPVSLAKRSPLATGYVAGIGSGAEHHHNHLAGAATGHHHDARESDSFSFPG